MRISRRFVTSLLFSPAWWLGVAMSVILSLLTAQMIQDKNQAEFDAQSENAELAIRARIKSYIDVLQGLRAFFYANDRATREEFHAYVRELHTAQSFPGIRNLNFAPRLFAAEKKSFQAAMRNDPAIVAAGYPPFTIHPSGERDEYHPLAYQEPMESNLQVWGFDMASIPRVRKALDISRDTGELSASGQLIKITGPNHHTGLAMRLPLYRRGMPTGTVEQRRAAYYGTVGAGFDIAKLMLGAIDKNTLRYMRVKLYDIGRVEEPRENGTINPERLLFDSGIEEAGMDLPASSVPPDALFVKRAPIEIGARIWEAEFVADKAAMRNTLDIALPWFVLAVGLLASLLLYSIYYSLASARRRAVEIANHMTKDLRDSEASLAEAQHMAHLGSWLLEPASGKMTWSNETFRIFGLDMAAATSHDAFIERIHAEDRPLIRGGIEKSLTSGEEFQAEHRITQADGAIRWVQTIIRPESHRPEALLRGTIMDITEAKVTMEALKRSQELLRDLTTYQDRVKEDERKRIAREIHDELGQTLLALRIDVAMLDARTGKAHPRLNQKVRIVLGHIDATVKTIRTIINNLRPSVLDLGLTAAIEWQVAEFRRRSGIKCELIIKDQDLVVDDARATTLFRVLQESLTNVIRHAAATRVVIMLHCEDNNLVMQVIDNGVGIYPNNRRKSHSFGLLGIEERIHALHGKCIIDSEPGQGTTLTILIPLETEDAMLSTLS